MPSCPQPRKLPENSSIRSRDDVAKVVDQSEKLRDMQPGFPTNSLISNGPRMPHVISVAVRQNSSHIHTLILFSKPLQTEPHPKLPTMSFPPPALRAIAADVAALLKARHESIAVAETVSDGGGNT
jgi:hypothetical protein